MGKQPTVSVATFNTHAGIDGWGRPFDVVEACRAIDADVLALQEAWSPADGPSMATRVADALGYTVIELPLAEGRRALPHPEANRRWIGWFDLVARRQVLFLDSEVPFSPRITDQPRYQEAPLGGWGIALLSRLPIWDHSVITLGRLRRDRVRRGALVATLGCDGRPLTVVATHMSHLLYASPLHFLRLRRTLSRLRAADRQAPAVLLGDMNMWGPPVGWFFPGWRRTVRGASWPAWNPHSQLDHVLTTGDLDFIDGAVLGFSGSDHLPVRAQLSLR